MTRQRKEPQIPVTTGIWGSFALSREGVSDRNFRAVTRWPSSSSTKVTPDSVAVVGSGTCDRWHYALV